MSTVHLRVGRSRSFPFRKWSMTCVVQSGVPRIERAVLSLIVTVARVAIIACNSAYVLRALSFSDASKWAVAHIPYLIAFRRRFITILWAITRLILILLWSLTQKTLLLVKPQTSLPLTMTNSPVVNHIKQWMEMQTTISTMDTVHIL